MGDVESGLYDSEQSLNILIYKIFVAETGL